MARIIQAAVVLERPRPSTARRRERENVLRRKKTRLLIGSHALKDLPGDGLEIDGRAETKVGMVFLFCRMGEARMITANPPRLACLGAIP